MLPPKTAQGSMLPSIRPHAPPISPARMASTAAFGMSVDAKRPAAWAEYGFREWLTIDDYRRACERGGASGENTARRGGHQDSSADLRVYRRSSEQEILL